jgi:hypothetical protein
MGIKPWISALSISDGFIAASLKQHDHEAEPERALPIRDGFIAASLKPEGRDRVDPVQVAIRDGFIAASLKRAVGRLPLRTKFRGQEDVKKSIFKFEASSALEKSL